MKNDRARVLQTPAQSCEMVMPAAQLIVDIPNLAAATVAEAEFKEVEQREPLRSTIKLAPEANRSDRMLTPKETANFMRLSESWLAKARMRGDGPPYVKIGRSIRYSEFALLQWVNLHLRQSTSER